MEGVVGGNTVRPNSIGKSEVLDVKPMRTLVPVFPEPPEGAPFICVSPNGPFPSGFTPFFPFSGVNPAASPIQTAGPSGGQSVSPMNAHGNQRPKPATQVDAHGNPIKKRGRGRPRTRFP